MSIHGIHVADVNDVVSTVSIVVNAPTASNRKSTISRTAKNHRIMIRAVTASSTVATWVLRSENKHGMQTRWRLGTAGAVERVNEDGENHAKGVDGRVRSAD